MSSHTRYTITGTVRDSDIVPTNATSDSGVIFDWNRLLSTTNQPRSNTPIIDYDQTIMDVLVYKPKVGDNPYRTR